MSRLHVRGAVAVVAAVVAALLIAVSAGPAGATGVSAPGRPAATPAPTCGGAVLPPKPGGGTWVCTFDDEFAGTALDRTKWLPQTTAASGFTSGPPGYQTCYLDSTNNIAVSGGYLRLTARRETAPFSCSGRFTTQYTSGEVMTYTKWSQTYGKFEVRAKLPPTAVKGLQETFWLWPDNWVKYGLTYPDSGEIDFAEFYSDFAAYDVPTIHYPLDPSTIDLATNTNVYTSYSCVMDYTQFNTYGLEWSPGRLRILLNGAVCLTDNYVPSNVAAPAPFDQPFFFSLTQALGIVVGGNDNAFDPAVTPMPATTQIDYVRAWQ